MASDLRMSLDSERLKRDRRSPDSPSLVASSFLHSLTMPFGALICKIGVSPSTQEPPKEAERDSGRVPAWFSHTAGTQ